ncbi:MAG: substrate-binding domain-containing protein, partial [Acidimicrobiales bacterium]
SVAALGAGACGSTTKSSSTTTTTVSLTHSSGAVDFLYAASLENIFQNQIAPDFNKATGATAYGLAGGSSGLASDISGETDVADVLISAAASVDVSLEGAANGNWVSWYANLGTTPLVLGYNPSSKFAPALQSMPWYEVLTQPGILVGRTDPTIDPKGALTVTALQQTATAQNVPALNGLLNTSDVFPEASLVGELQSGQLDAGFFYAAEAKAANIPTVPLTGVSLAGNYTVTVVNRAPHLPAALAFVNYLCSAPGQSLLTSAGVMVNTPPTVVGPTSAVPAALRPLFHLSG